MFTVSKISTVLLLIVGIFSIVLYLFSPFKANYGSKPKIVVTNYFVASLCKDLCKESASIYVVASNSFCCGDFEPTIKDLLSIRKSDAFIYYENDIISSGQPFESFLKAHMHDTELLNLTEISTKSYKRSFLRSCSKHDMNMHKCNCETTNYDSKDRLLFQDLEEIINVLYSFFCKFIFENSGAIDENFIEIKRINICRIMEKL